MPYRIDAPGAGGTAFDTLVELGALDAEVMPDGGIAAVLPDSVPPERVAGALGIADLRVSPATGRDDGSVWIVRPRPIQVGRLRLVPAHLPAGAGDLRLVDGAVFGTGLHPATGLCLEAIAQIVQAVMPDAVLDVGTGSGVLALGALRLGVPAATAVDIDAAALRAASENARLNALESRLHLTHGGPGDLTGTWPLVVANVLAAPLIEMAPALVRRVGRHGHLVLSGIASSLEGEVQWTYRRLGMGRVRGASRGGWVALVLKASW